MENFEFCAPTKIVFGRGTERRIGGYIKRYGKKILLHYGGGSIRKNGLYERVVRSLKEAGVCFLELGGVEANPKLSKVHEGIELCRREGVEAILAVGGGSVIDSAKAIGIGVGYDGDVWDFYDREHAVKPDRTLPVAVILTIPAAGSECSGGSVITKEEGKLKRDAGSEVMRPVLAVLNPELAFTLPKGQAACGLADILAHILERYFTNVTHVGLTDMICEAGMRCVVRYAPRVLAKADDYDSWAELMWCGTLAHNDLMSTGRVGDWASHMIEHELSGLYGVAHGAGLAVVIPAWMKYVYKKDIPRFVRYASEVFGVETDYFDPEGTALEGIRRTEEFFRSLGLTTSFLKLGGRREDIPYLAEHVVRDANSGTTGHFVPLMPEDVARILELAQ